MDLVLCRVRESIPGRCGAVVLRARDEQGTTHVLAMSSLNKDKKARDQDLKTIAREQRLQEQPCLPALMRRLTRDEHRT